ncbi:MAG: 5-methyltetrahydropteroyltriglutamate--homocysteine S-methyltransferase [Betaproteobacteria bacterium]|nr:5-methyltetrahydropteroyltriglutamate--homocysteine S-methyltransferase [Betaproteobacteria bacterium]
MKPPFRADHVGSLLRPKELTEARRNFKLGKLDATVLKGVEDRSIREAVERQESIGLQSITDGEFRRDWWHLDFMSQLDGVALGTNAGPGFAGTGEQPPMPSVSGKVGCSKPIMADDFIYLKRNTKQTAKFTIPSPAMLHLRGGRSSISKEVYPDLGAFWADTSAAWRKAIRHLADAGCTYLQLDDVSFSYLCDPKIRETCRRNGDDPAQLPRTYADAVNNALKDRPAGMTVTMHTCRGNFKSSWVASGGYESVAEAMFSSDVDAFFMEFDSERAGGFEPLRHLPAGQKVVLGLVTSKSPVLEGKDFIKRRIEEACKYVPLDSLCLSPQCGFSSTHHGNSLTEDEQWRKLERVVEVAREVWN